MNPRIRELARLAQGKNPADYEPNDDVIIMATSDVAKFAELIVRECMEQCAYTPDSGEDWNKGVKWAYNQIKQHFGVEE